MSEAKDLATQATKAAQKIAEGMFEDPGKVADVVAKRILDDLDSGDDRKIKKAREKIREQQMSYARTDQPSGTAGAILTRLQASGLDIELVPEDWLKLEKLKNTVQ